MSPKGRPEGEYRSAQHEGSPVSLAVPRGVVPGVLLVAGLLNGCTSLSGVGGETQYACPAPRGVQCGSVTANYLQSVRGELPGQPPTERAGAAQATTPGTANALADSGTPLYFPPRILKLWVAPWEDRDGVLHDAAFVFVPVDHGHWLVFYGDSHLRRSFQRRNRRVNDLSDKPAHIDKLSVEINKALKTSAITVRFANDDAKAGGGTPADFAALIKSEQDRWSKVVKAANIRIE